MRVFWSILLVGLAACGFNPHPQSGALPCDKGCPSGYHCAKDGTCRTTELGADASSPSDGRAGDTGVTSDTPSASGHAGGPAGTGGAGGVTSTGELTGSGGTLGIGGVVGTGGRVGSGGVAASGGLTGSGGITGSGGLVGSGGAIGMGGAAGTGGATGTRGTGTGGTTGSTDEDAVANDKTALSVTYANGDSASSITRSIVLPTVGTNGSNISWSSDHPKIVSGSGAVVRPTTTTTTVTLTATITKGSSADTKTFSITVIISDAGVVANDKATLQVGYTGADAATSVTQDLKLATAGDGGSLVIWNSAPPGIVGSTGIVTRPTRTTAVTLTATLNKGSSSDTKTFLVYVVGSAAQLGFLYAAGNGLSVYRINTDGSLTAVPGSPFGTEYSSFVTVAPSNEYLFALGYGLRSYSINPDGSLASVYGSPSVTDDGANSIAINPNGTFAYVTNAGSMSSTIAVYGISSRGLPVSIGTPISTAPETGPTHSVVDPTGDCLYVADSNGVPGVGKVGAYAIGADGSLTLIGSPIAGDADNYGNSIAITPSGKYVYMSNSGTISAYSTNSDGSLKSLGLPYPVHGGDEVANITMDPMGRFLYVGLVWFGGAVTGFKISADGSLSGEVTFSTDYSVASIAIDRTGKYGYVADTNDNVVAMFSIDVSTGAFTPLPSPTISSAGPTNLATTH